MNKLSIKQKLLIYNIVIQSIILIIFSFSIYKTLQLSTLDRIQTSLKVIVLDIADDILDHKDNLQESEFDEEKEYKFEPLYIRLLKINEKNLDVIKTTPFPKELTLNKNHFKEYKHNTIYFYETSEYIISTIKIDIYEDDYLVQVATDYNFLNSTMQNLLYTLMFIVPIILILAIIGGYFLIYKSFLPIEQIVQKLRNITAGNLSKRLPENYTQDEIDLLTQEINNLLTRLEISFEKISQFSSDASHELKTPLTIIRGEIEVALRKERSSLEYEKTLKSCLDEILIIQQTTDDLLFLARNENNLFLLEEEVYIDEITNDAIKELESFAALKSIHVSLNIQDIMQIKGHNQLLKIAIKNVLKNAISFSHPNQNVEVSNYQENGFYVIRIKDQGIGIAKEEQTKIFEKFYRTDKSRNKESGGTGLGMAIVDKIVKIHHGAIELQSQENEGTTVLLKFKIPQGFDNEY